MSEAVEVVINTECCANCQFYSIIEKICRRYPPAVLVTAMVKNKAEGWASVFPPMLPVGWCGEYQKSKTP